MGATSNLELVKMLGRIATQRACARIGSRSLATHTGAVTTAASGEVQAWRPKVQVTRHLSPYEQEIIAPPSKFLKYQANAFVENAPDWVPGVLFSLVCITLETISS